MSFLTDVAVLWNGTAVNETVGDVQRSLLVFPTWNGGDLERIEDELMGGVRVEVGDPVQGAATIDMLIAGEYVGASSTQTVIDRALTDDWGLMGARYSPYLGVKELRVDRVNAAAGAVSRVADAHVLRAPSNIPNLRGGDRDPGQSKRTWVYPIALRVPAGLWHRREALTDTGDIGASPDATPTIVNDGLSTVAVRVDIGSISGTVTGFTITLNAVVVATITDTSGFSNGDYVDFGYTTEGHLKISDPTTMAVAVGDWVDCPIGSQVYTVTRTSGSGTGVATLSAKPRYGSW